MPEADELNAVTDLPDAEPLSSQHGGDVDSPAMQSGRRRGLRQSIEIAVKMAQQVQPQPPAAASRLSQAFRPRLSHPVPGSTPMKDSVLR